MPAPSNFIAKSINFRGLVTGSVVSDYDALVWKQTDPEPTTGRIVAQIPTCGTMPEPYVINVTLAPGEYFYKLRHIPSGQSGPAQPFTIDAPVNPVTNTITAELWDVSQTPMVKVGNLADGSTFYWPENFNIKLIFNGLFNQVRQTTTGGGLAPASWGPKNVAGGADVETTEEWVFGLGGGSSNRSGGNYSLVAASLKGGVVQNEINYNFELLDDGSNTNTTESESQTPPTGLNKIALSYSAGTKEASVHIDGVDMLLRVSSATAPQPTGLTWVSAADDTSWDSTTYIPGTTQFAQAGYTRIYRLNPGPNSFGGLENGKQYFFDIKKSGTSQYFRTAFTMPNADIVNPQIFYSTQAGEGCDLVWEDGHTPGSTAIDTRVQNGVRQLFIKLYSSRGNLTPFTTKLYASDQEVYSFSWSQQGQWNDLPNSLPAGYYTVKVVDKFGCETPARGITIASALSETQRNTPPSGLVKMAISYEVATRNASVSIDGPNMLLRVSSDLDPQPSGTTWVSTANDTAWNSTTYIPGTTQYTQEGYTRIYRLNPLSSTEGGLVGGKTYYFDIKEAGSNEFFRTTFTMPTVDINPIQVIYSSVSGCDLVWSDSNTPGDVSIETRWQSGVRQIFIKLYSSRGNISPFSTKIYQGTTVVHTFTWSGAQGQWHNLPGSISDGSYGVEVTDKDGCSTTKRNITFAANPNPGGGGGSGDYTYSAQSLPYTTSPKDFFTLIKNGNLYTESFQGDSVVSGKTTRSANGRTYVAFYWIDGIRYADGNDNPKAFVDVNLPVGRLTNIKKVYVDSAWVSTFDQLKANDYDTHYGGNDPGDLNKLYKSISQNVTT